MAEGSAKPGGSGLADNLSVQAARADWLYHSQRYQVKLLRHATNLVACRRRLLLAAARYTYG